MTLRFVALAVLASGCGEVQRMDGPVDAVAGSEQLAPVAYTTRVEMTPEVTFGGPAGQFCVFTMSLQQMTIDLNVRPTGEVISGRVQNINVEGLIGGCSAPANRPVIAVYDFQSFTPTAAGANIVFKGADANETKVDLIGTVSRNGNGYNAVLTFHRVDLPPPLDWTVVVTAPMTQKQ